MKRQLRISLIPLFLVALVAFSISCSPEPVAPPVEPEPKPAPSAPTVPGATYDELYAGKIYNATSEQLYSSFTDAVEEASSGDLIVLCKDVELTEKLVISKSLTIDFNSHVISRASFSASNEAILSFEGTSGSHIAHAELRNGVLKGSAYSKLSNALVRFIGVDDAVITGMDILGQTDSPTATQSNSIYNAYSILTIDNGDYDRIVGRIITYMSDGQLASRGVRSQTIINGGKFSNDVSTADPDAIILSNENGKAIVIINGGTFSGGLSGVSGCDGLTINAGTFSVDVSGYVADTSYFETRNGKWIVKENGSAPSGPSSENPKAPALPDYSSLASGWVHNVTKNTKSVSLAGALADSSEGDVIVLCRDETVSSTLCITHGLTLDLNGHTLECTTARPAILVRSNPINKLLSPVTIRRGTVKGIPTESNGANAVISVVDCEKLVLQNLTVISSVPEGQAIGACAMYINGTKEAYAWNLDVTGKTVAHQHAVNDTSVNLTIIGGTYRPDPNAPDRNVLRLYGDKGSITGKVTVIDASFDGIVEVGGGLPHPDLCITSGTWTTDVTAYVPTSSEIVRNGSIWTVSVR